MEEIRVLVTSAGSTAAQNLAHVLNPNNGFRLIGGDIRSAHAGVELFQDHVELVSGSDPSYIDNIAAEVARHSIDIVVPVMEAELAALASPATRASIGSKLVLMSSEHAIKLSLDKHKLAIVFTELGLWPPRVLAKSANDFCYPVFSRPRMGSGSRGARALNSGPELQRAVAATPDLVITEFIDGPEYSIDGFAWPEGQLVHAILRTRHQVRGGLCVESSVRRLGQMRSEVARACKGLGLFGFFNLQFRIDAAGQARFFDLNPRLGGAMILSFTAGLNAAEYLRCALHGHAISPQHVEQVGLRLLRRWHNVITPRENHDLDRGI